MSFYFENQQTFTSTSSFFKKQAHKSYKNTIAQFKKNTGLISKFKMAFICLFLLEIFLSLFLIVNFSRSSLIAIALGSIVLSVFTYFVFLFYFQAKKPQQINDLKEKFVTFCRQGIAMPEGLVEHHLSIANALMHLSFHMNGLEYSYFSFIKAEFLNSFLEKLSLFFHQEDVFKMQELLFFSAIEEHIIQIRNTPTDLEVHVSLAHAYVSLAKFYMESEKKSYPRKFVKKIGATCKQKFEVAAKKAIEEFVILKEFAPNDPWIHAQLASCYHSLQMFEEESSEYETMLELSPNDKEIMFRLGQIYFQLSKNAQGLQVYEDLKKEGHEKAEELLAHYSGMRFFEDIDVSL